ncbi:ABC transporter substrate-binding protein [Lysinibacter sp. HNR]|uniref:ABC transporter substrate-binding protein n=1 Tax=Lysinibacter sp. HNR TaxID=3031408 RepID=UPI002435EF8F|nr:ABC transporter substrate-binding protein [Lysinibacter sp. HNR]WGD36368.1 ABC transporter substrate-binding protein [Lysinibacter sp. HNR]
MSILSSRLYIPTFIVAVSAVFLAGCTVDTRDSGSEQELTLAIEGANVFDGHLDIHKTQIDSSMLILRNVFDSLVDINAEGDVVPWLATDWEVSEDGLVYTFDLRQDVTFHDGEKFTAEAVKLNFEHVLDPQTESASALSKLGGSDVFAGVEVVDDYRVVLRLNSPFSPLLRNLSSPQLGFYSPSVLVGKRSELAAGGKGVTVGTGPFIVEKVVPGQNISLLRNDNYEWQSQAATHAGPSQLTSLTVNVLPENTVRIGAMRSGEADIATELPPSVVNELGSGIIVNVQESSGIPYSLYLNDGFGVFADQKVREGFRSALDIDTAVETIFFGEFDRAWSILSPNTPNAYDSSIAGSWEFNPEAANAFFEEAGWTERDSQGYRTKDGARLGARWIAWTPVSSEHQSLANAFQENLKDVGFELKRENLEPAQYNEQYGPRTFDLTDWGFDGLDGDVLRNHLHSDGFQNVSTVVRPEIDQLLERAVATNDPQEREELYQQVQRWNNEFVSIIPVYVPAVITAQSDRVEGLEFDSTGQPLLYGVSLK